MRLTERLAAFPVPGWRTPAEVTAADRRILLQALHSPGPEGSILIAEEPEGPAGYIFSTTRQDYFTGESHAHVEILVVEQLAEGRGIGRFLIGAAEAWARARGYGRITLNVFAANQRAKALYEHLGYGAETVHYHKYLK